MIGCSAPSAGSRYLLISAFIYLIKIGGTFQPGHALSRLPVTLHHPLPAGAGSRAELTATETQGMQSPLPRNQPRPLVSYYESAENFTSSWKKGLNQSAASSFSPTSCTGKRRTGTEPVTKIQGQGALMYPWTGEHGATSCWWRSKLSQHLLLLAIIVFISIIVVIFTIFISIFMKPILIHPDQP